MNNATARTIALIAAMSVVVTLGSSPAVAADAPSPTPPAASEATPTPVATETPAQATETSRLNTPADTGAVDAPSSGVAVTALPSVFIQLPQEYPIARLNASKESVPLDPKTEPHAVLSINDPLTASNNMSNVSLEEIKGRGNFTFTLEKKPYQIKFDKSTAVLGMAKAKTWILLANHADPSLLRNKFAFDLAADFGIAGSPDSRLIDLTVNGEYLGNYLLSEKVEVKANRLELKDPGGLLLELDNFYGQAEETYFRTAKSRSLFVLKDAAADTDTPLSGALADSYSNTQAYIAAFESELYAPDPDWSKISAMIDIESFIKYYFVQELASNSDVSQSSVYLWRDGIDDVLHAGPAWDFDVALGNYAFESLGGDFSQDYVKNARVLRAPDGNDWFTQLFRNEEFVVAVNDLFDSQLEAKVVQAQLRLDSDITNIEQSATANFARWKTVLGFAPPFPSGRTVASSWAEEAAQLRSWASSRIAHVSRAHSAEMPVLKYSTHASSIGWQPGVTGGLISGTAGRGLQLEALDMSLVGNQFAGALQSRAHVEGLGWTAWQTGDARIGTTGQGRQLEAVQFRLTGELATRFDISYRAHVQNVGWMNWVGNGSVAGTTGRGLQIESAHVRLLEKSSSTSPAPQAALEYSAHVADIGWMPSASAPAQAGTSGRGLGMQALRASVSSDQLSGGIEYRAHAQNRGWMEWTTAPGVIGTTGLGLRLEAVEARLTGDLAARYDLRYQAHVQGSGWQEWFANGATAGTTGQGLQLEALRLELVAKAP